MATLYVHNGKREGDKGGSDWDNAYDDLAEAIGDANPGDTIKVKAGTHVIQSSSDYINPGSGMTIEGGYDPESDSTDAGDRDLYAFRTIIDGDGTYQCLSSVGSGAAISGFWFKNGFNSSTDGGAARLTATCSFTDCTWTHCEVEDPGGGGAVAVISASGVSFTRCEFGRCSAETNGGAVYLNSSTTACTFTRCRFTGNSAGSDGGCVYNDGYNNKFLRCVFAQNSCGDDGGAILNNGGTGIVIDMCDIMHNNAGDGGTAYGGGIANLASGTVTLVNTIVRGNACGAGASYDQLYDIGTITQTYSNVENGTTGSNGNIDVAPHFLSIGEHPYTLDTATNNNDAANQGSTDFLETDILGNAVYDDPDTADTGAGSPDHFDIGAYEYQGVEPDYLDYTKYVLNLGNFDESSLPEDGHDGKYRMYAICRVPRLPPFWSETEENTVTRIVAASEIYHHETDSSLRERYEVGGQQIFNRETEDETHSGPTWEEAVATGWQDPDYSYMALMNSYPEFHKCSKFKSGHGDKPLFVIVQARYGFTLTSATDDLDVYNVFLRPVMDDRDARDDLKYHMQINGMLSADMPMSSLLVKETLMQSLMCLLYEARSPMTVPMFGMYKNDTIVT